MKKLAFRKDSIYHNPTFTGGFDDSLTLLHNDFTLRHGNDRGAGYACIA